MSDDRLKLLREERKAIQMDLHACRRSYGILQAHIKNLKDFFADSTGRFFLNWAGKDAMMGSMEVCINHLEELLERYDQAISDAESIEGAEDNVVPLTEARKRDKS